MEPNRPDNSTNPNDTNDTFKDACRLGTFELVQSLIGQQTDVTAGFIEACIHNHLPIVNLLITDTHDIYEGLYEGCVHANHDIVMFILNHMNPDNTKSPHDIETYNHCLDLTAIGDTPAHLKLATTLVNRGANKMFLDTPCQLNNVNMKDLFITHGCTDFNMGLEGAARGGHLHLVIEMVSQGATNFEESLDLACIHGHSDIVDYLIPYVSAGINFNHCFDLACEHAHFEVAKRLIRHVTNFGYGFKMACKHANINLTKLILDYTTVSVYNLNTGLIELTNAYQTDDRIYLARLLVDYGASNVNQGLYHAAIKDAYIMMQLMIDHQANNFEQIEFLFREREDTHTLMVIHLTTLEYAQSDPIVYEHYKKETITTDALARLHELGITNFGSHQYYIDDYTTAVKSGLRGIILPDIIAIIVTY